VFVGNYLADEFADPITMDETRNLTRFDGPGGCAIKEADDCFSLETHNTNYWRAARENRSLLFFYPKRASVRNFKIRNRDRDDDDDDVFSLIRSSTKRRRGVQYRRDASI